MDEKMKTYRVEIREMLYRVVETEAPSATEAERKVSKEWSLGQHVLGAEDFLDVSFTAEEV